MYLGNVQYMRWSDRADAQADLRLCCSHMALAGFLITWLMTWLNYAIATTAKQEAILKIQGVP